ncbi:carbohydrate ABC transporter permease [Petroclostridium xylanilyticum]|jgi:alpha-1,4-digalacturonate transport system permease protein|uniref:carbohydrate ABC transporter permease n=1 Tax=Petroclostridium xylanilyticum TaxID=1792311 RepID=UPI000B995B9D|nr:carbohydrate ABC transporter permease [Petroclostridium xylanilyticum]
MNQRRNIYAILGSLLLILATFVFIFPVLWIVLSSFKPGNELFSYPITLFPKNATVENYINTFNQYDFLLYFKNTFIVTVTSTIITLAINTMAGFAFAKYRFRGRDLLFVAFLSTTMLPTEVIMSPTFTVVSKLGLYNSLWGIIIPPIATPTGIFLMRQYFLSVPDSILESARIDGAKERTIFWRLMVPIAKPVISTLTIFSFMWRWNDFIWPLLVISEPKKYTLQLAISNLSGQFSIDWNTLLSASVISMIPVLIVFLIFQKNIIDSMMSSGLKEG